MSVLGGLAINGGATLGKYLLGRANKPKRRKFKNTSYGRRLNKISTEGAIPQAQKNMVLGNIGRQAGNVTSKATANYRGRLTALGAGDSLASAGKIGEMESKAAGQIGRASERLDTTNALSKKRAKDQYARAETQFNEQQDNIQDSYKRRLNSELIGGLTSAASKAYSAHSMKKFLEDSEADFSDPKEALGWALDQADPDQAMKQLRQAGYASRDHSGGKLFDKNTLIPALQTMNETEGSRIVQMLIANGLLSDDLAKKFAE